MQIQQKTDMQSKKFLIDGQTLSTDSLHNIIQAKLKIDLTEKAWERVKKSRGIITHMMSDPNRVVYGINTGFGNFADKIISQAQTEQLQDNLIRSHAVQVGHPISLNTTRRMMILRINTLCKGRSGISTEVMQRYIDAYNSDFLPMIPEKGTVGASGDLAPLSHLALGLMGEGKAWDSKTQTYKDSLPIMKEKGLKPITLSSKEGLALINGTQFMSSIVSEVEHRARIVIESAIIVYAFSVEIFGFSPDFFNQQVIQTYEQSYPSLAAVMKATKAYLELENSQLHSSRMHDGQKNNICSSMMFGMEAIASAQDNIALCRRMIEEEMNSATDNPLVYSKDDGFEDDQLISAGNFHGEYVAKASDYISMALFGLGRLSEARIQRYLNERTSNLPGFLVKEGGLNSGFMIAQYTSAALLSESKVLVKPASTDSISTSASQEDHVSMGGYAARKSREVLENMAYILGIELMHCLQAVDLIEKTPSKKLFQIHQKVRQRIPFMESDRYFGPEMTTAKEMIMSGLHLL